MEEDIVNALQNLGFVNDFRLLFSYFMDRHLICFGLFTVCKL